MSDNVRESAERLRRDLGGEFDYRDIKRAYQFADDMKTVVNAYLAEHPADDGEPITEDWLATFMTPSMLSVEVHGFSTYDSGVHVSIARDRQHRWFATICQDGEVKLPHIKTRGDVRRLAKALGVELREGN